MKRPFNVQGDYILKTKVQPFGKPPITGKKTIDLKGNTIMFQNVGNTAFNLSFETGKWTSLPGSVFSVGAHGDIVLLEGCLAITLVESITVENNCFPSPRLEWIELKSKICEVIPCKNYLK